MTTIYTHAVVGLGLAGCIPRDGSLGSTGPWPLSCLSSWTWMSCRPPLTAPRWATAASRLRWSSPWQSAAFLLRSHPAAKVTPRPGEWQRSLCHHSTGINSAVDAACRV